MMSVMSRVRSHQWSRGSFMRGWSALAITGRLRMAYRSTIAAPIMQGEGNT